MLRHRRSLCVIDEFGKGTLTADGIGLLAAALNAFATAPAPPKVVACTHFSEVLNAAYLPRCAKSARQAKHAAACFLVCRMLCLLLPRLEFCNCMLRHGVLRRSPSLAIHLH